MPPRTKNPTVRGFNPQRYLCKANADKFPQLMSRTIITGRSVEISSKHRHLLHNRLIDLHWEGIINISNIVYPTLVRDFYANLSHFTENEDGEFELNSYVKGQHMKLTVHTLSTILGTVVNPIEVYVTNEVELREYLEHLTRYPQAVYQAITVGAQSAVGHMRSKDLKPKLRLLHRFLSSNVVPKGGHIDAVTVKDAFILWCFEEKRQIDVNFIILNEMAEIATTGNRGLAFGGLLTKIFTHFRVDLRNEDTQNLAPPITDYFIGRADILTEQPPPQPQSQPQPQPPSSAGPSSSSQPSQDQPPLWPEFQDFTSAMLDVQNTMLNEFREYRHESQERHVTYDRRISRVEDQVNQLYQHYYPPPPPPQ